MQTNPKVDAYLSKAKKWQPEVGKLREYILDRELTEEFKWGKPCYSLEKSNVVIIISFKEYCALSFFKGSLLKDAKGILVSPGENSQAMRQIRLTSVQEIVEMESVIKAYLDEAIELEKAGVQVNFTAIKKLTFPVELQNVLDKDPAFKTAFEALTPGRQRAYNLYFSAAKQSKTRESRVEKYMQHILEGKGMNDR